MSSVMTDKEVREALAGDIHLFKKIYGYSAYELAVKNGFKGSEEEWLYSLNAYSLAVKNGFKGTEADWLLSITAYGLAVAVGFEGTLEEWIASLKGEKGDPGTMELHGELDAQGERIVNVGDPVDDSDAVSKKYLEQQNGASKNYVDENFVAKTDQLDGNNFTVKNVAEPSEDTDAVNKKYVHDNFQLIKGEDISENFISQTINGITVTKKNVYKQSNTICGSITFTVSEGLLSEEAQMAIDIRNAYRPKCELICPIVVRTEDNILYLSEGKNAYIEPITGWMFLPAYSDNAGFKNEFIISFTYLCG